MSCGLRVNRVHNQSEYFRNDETEAELPGAQKLTWEDGIALSKRYTSKWALLWKSIIRSSLGITAYPYCLYIRSLDLRNLDSLFDDAHFRSSSLDSFFADEMSSFLKAQEILLKPGQQKTRSGKKSSYIRL